MTGSDPRNTRAQQPTATFPMPQRGSSADQVLRASVLRVSDPGGGR